MSEVAHTVTKEEWSLFVWMVDNCEKKQGNACKGCTLLTTCLKLYQNVSNICISNRVSSEFEHENQQPSKGNPCVESVGHGIGRTIRRYRRDARLSEGLGV